MSQLYASRRIMLVDDEAISNFILGRMIRHVDENMQVFDFVNPYEALAQLPYLRPDLIFLDVNMPLMTGWDFIRKMAALGLRIPIHILTSSTSEVDAQEARHNMYVHSLFIKPMDQDVLAHLLVGERAVVAA